MRGAEGGAAPRILVADDDGGVRTSLAANLQLEGYDVVEASDGKHALALLREQTFDLVLSDVVMPEVNGVEVLKGAKALSPQTPVVLISAFVSESLVNTAVAEGLYAMLYKPVGIPQVLRIVVRALTRRALLVVDDAAPYLESLAASLRSLGIVVETALDGQQALEYARQNGVDACVLDLMLPAPGGIEICRDLRKLDREMDIIGITGSSDPALLRSITREGVPVCLRKPFEVRDLLFALVKARSDATRLRS
ncbi:MAG TPA: response regulator [Polyangiaceae bacterium]